MVQPGLGFTQEQAIVGPFYVCFGLGLRFFVTQGVGRAVTGMNECPAHGCDAAGGLVAIYWFDLGVAGFFAAVAAGFWLYAAMLVHAVFSVLNRSAAEFQRCLRLLRGQIRSSNESAARPL